MRLERLLSATKEDAVQGTYAYDDMGREASSVEGAVTNLYAYRGTETLFQNIYNNYSIDFLYAGSLRVARLDTSSGTGYNTYEYFHVDPLGSTRMVTSSTKSVLFTDSYQPFGQDNGTPTGSSAEKFAGKSWSTSIKLYYFYMRWYDPTIGRFISVDPKAGKIGNPQSLNAYVYVLNNPCNHNDPTGECLDLHTIADSAIGLALTYYGLEGVAWANPVARLDLVQQFITTYGPQTIQYLGRGGGIDVKGLVQDVIVPAIWSMGSGIIAKYLASAAPGFVLHWLGATVGATEAELIAATAVTAISLGYALETGSEPGRLCSNFFEGPPLFQPGGTISAQSSIVSGRRIIYAVSDWDIPSSRAGVIAGI